MSYPKKISTTGMLAIIAVILAGIFLFLSGKPPAPARPTPALPEAADAAQEDIKSVVDANNRFALELYSNLSDKEAAGNIFFSPYSISTALAMTYEGARNQTAEEIKSALHFPENDAARRSSVAAIYNRLNKKGVKYKLHTANALWVQKDYQILSDYIETVEKFYAGEANNVDFIHAPEGARRTINAWVEKKTNDKIKNLFSRNSVDESTRLVLANAVYFKGDWAKQFKRSETRNEDFRVSQSQKVKAPLMRRTDDEAEFNYAETEESQILEMPYEGEEISMLVLLPKNYDLKSLEKSLTVENLNQWRRELTKQRVDVYLPKFTFTSKYSLNENLKELGMSSAFLLPDQSSRADFSGISGKKDLFLQEVVHQAFVDVNEEGTEAAAATGVAFEKLAEPIAPVFRADHPFLFLIYEKATGNILFMGRVASPVA
jgi:serpin B